MKCDQVGPEMIKIKCKIWIRVQMMTYKYKIIILLNEQSRYWVTSLLAKLWVDWCRCNEVLIDSYNCYSVVLNLLKIQFITIIGPENIKF